MASARPLVLSLLAVLLTCGPQSCSSYSTSASYVTSTMTTASYGNVPYGGNCSETLLCQPDFRCDADQCVCPLDSFRCIFGCCPESYVRPSGLSFPSASVTASSLTIGWSVSYSSYVSAFNVSWRAEGDGDWDNETVSAGSRSYTISGLQSATTYVVQVASIVQDLRTLTVSSSPVSQRTKSLYGEDCSNVGDCLETTRISCDQGRCVCSSGYFRHSSRCISENYVRPSYLSFPSTSATASSITIGWSFSYSSSYLTNVSAFNVSWRAEGDGDWDNETVSVESRAYTISGLQSATTYVVQVASIVQDLRTLTVSSSPVSQRTKSLYREACSSASHCFDTTPISCYQGRCVCSREYFRHSNSCISVDSYLTPSNFSTEVLTPSRVRVSWSVGEEFRSAVTSYRVQSSLNNGVNSSTDNVREPTVTLRGLRPGLRQRVTVQSFIDRDGIRQLSSGRDAFFYTNPDTPGPMNMTASFVSHTFAYIRFETVKVGGAYRYHAHLTSPNGDSRNVTTQASHPMVTFFDLVPGQEYRISITAEYAGLFGTPYVDSFTTPAEASSVPVYGAVLLFLVPALLLIAVVVLFVLTLRGYPLFNWLQLRKQEENPYNLTRGRGDEENTYCSLQTLPPDTSSPPSSPASAAAATDASQSIYVNANSSSSSSNGGNTEAGQHVYVNSEQARSGGGARPKKAPKLKVKAEQARSGGGARPKKAPKPKVKAEPTGARALPF